MTITRRAFLGAFGAGALTATGVGLAANAVATINNQDAAEYGVRYPFYGTHQAGITTPMQDYLHFAALDLTTDSRDRLIKLLQAWTAASAAMTQGREIGDFGAVNGPYDAPPEDTGEALDLPPSGLTITIGFGPTLFRTVDGTDRFGIADQTPSELRPMPSFPGDMLEPAISGGDLCIQACANEPQVAVHAVRNLVRLAFGTAVVRWSQTGFGRSSATTHAQPTPRNLFGFKDGTANITSDDTTGQDDFVWVPAGELPAWMDGGTYLVARRIRMTIETWDRASLREQEAVFGRTKKEGAPLSGGGEFAAPDFTAPGNDGQPLIPADSHVALAHPQANGGHRILRRGYNFTDGSDELGRLNAGLFFLAFMRSIHDQFVPLQMRLARDDRMNEYVRYESLAPFAIPPGAGEGQYIGESLMRAT